MLIYHLLNSSNRNNSKFTKDIKQNFYVQGVDFYWKHRFSAFYILFDIKNKNTNDGKYYLYAE